jgi:murein DD-endopeptidase MepM/ murein hydrolase activator NlpD
MTMKLRQLSSDDLEELVKLIKGCTCSADPEDGLEKESLTLVDVNDYRDIILKNMDTSVEYVEKLNKTVEDDYSESLRDLSEKLAEQKSLEKLPEVDESKRTIGLLKDINEALKKYLEKIKEGGAPATSPAPGTSPGDFTAGTPPPLIRRAPGPAPAPTPAGPGRVIPTAKVAGAIAVVGSTAFIGDKAYAVTSERGMRHGRMHQGMDIAVPKNTPLAAHEEGEVVFAGTQRGYGNRVEVKTKDGRILAYSHLNSINVKPGQKVSAGEIVGLSGNTGTSRSSTGGDGSHLHMEVKDKDGNFLNPRTYLSSFVKPQDGMEAASSPATPKAWMRPKCSRASSPSYTRSCRRRASCCSIGRCLKRNCWRWRSA